MKCVASTTVAAGAIIFVQLMPLRVIAEDGLGALDGSSSAVSVSSAPPPASFAPSPSRTVTSGVPASATTGHLRHGGTAAAAGPRTGPDSAKRAERCSWSTATAKVCSERPRYAGGSSRAKLTPVVSLGGEGFNLTADPLGKAGTDDGSPRVGTIATAVSDAGSGSASTGNAAFGVSKLEATAPSGSTAAADSNTQLALATHPLTIAGRPAAAGDPAVQAASSDNKPSEPPTYAILLACLGMAAFMVFRRLS